MKTAPAILAIDIGLTNCKSIVFSEDGRILARSSAQYLTYSPGQGYLEQDPEDWWRAACQATQALFKKSPDMAPCIEGISVTGHMHALVCVDKEGLPVCRAIILGDQRSIAAAESINASLGMDKIYRTIGTRMDTSMPAAKILWLKEHAPGAFAEVDLFLNCKDYVRTKLVGDRLTDPIDACAMALYDLRSRTWASELLDVVGIQRSRLPDIVPSTALAGGLNPEAAEQLGLRAGIPVVVGAGDDIEVLGHGVVEPGLALEHLGTTGSVFVCTDRPIPESGQALEVYPHPMQDYWILGGSMTTAGSALVWATEVMGYQGLAEAFDTLTRSPPSNRSYLLFLPHLMGERSPTWVPNARGAWLGLSSTHTRDHMMRAVFEGVANALRHIIDCIEESTGPVSSIRIAPGPHDNIEWTKLRANAYQRTLAIVRTPHPTALGAMVLAAVGIGLYEDLPEAVRRTTSIEREVDPMPDEVERYRGLYRAYLDMQAALKAVW